jgi:serine O-acetyltransferase
MTDVLPGRNGLKTQPLSRESDPVAIAIEHTATPPAWDGTAPPRRERMPLFHNIRADLAAHGGRWGAQGFWALVVYRFGRWRYGIRPALLRKPFSALYHVLFKGVQIVTGIELPCEVEIGKNFVIDHHGGIIVSGYARFGDNCRIRTGVVIGLGKVDDPCAPEFGNNVDVGAGAKVLGRISIGDNVLIGANAVVVRDVPSNSIAVGIPAQVKPRRNTLRSVS